MVTMYSWNEFVHFWCNLVASHARTILAIILVVNLVLSSCLLFNLNTFSFDEPLRGFEARGSNLANRINSWKLISGKTSGGDDITLYPPRPTDAWKDAGSNWKGDSSHEVVNNSEVIKFRELDIEEEEEKKRLAAEVKRKQEEDEAKKKKSKKLGKNSAQLLGSGFCGELTDSYVQLVVEPISLANSDLLTHEYLIAVCEADAELRTLAEFNSRCISPDEFEAPVVAGSCCKSWSLPNLVARLVNKSDCNSLVPADVVFTREVLDSCVGDFHRRTLHRYCSQEPKSCPEIPPKCYAKDNLVYNLLNFILDIDFVDSTSRQGLLSAKVKRSNIFLPVGKSSHLLPFFQELEDRILSKPPSKEDEKLVRISSLDIGLKDTLFEQLLVQDMKLLAFSFLSIILILGIYSRSLMIVIMTSLNLTASLGGSLVIYRYLYGISFFPFMNLMTVIILVAVGCDSTFILCKTWSQGLKNQRPIQEHLLYFFDRTLISTLLTNETTALALLASFSSQITSLKCFSIYSSTAVFLLYFLTSISIPVVLVVTTENSIKFPVETRRRGVATVGGSDDSRLNHNNKKFLSKVKYAARQILRSCPWLKYLIVIVMLAIAASSAFLLIESFQVANNQHFSTFHPDHPFETFDVKYSNVFKFSQRNTSPQNPILSGLDITVVFGVEAADNGMYLDPFSRGSLEMDPAFDVSSPSTQKWLLEFCHKLRNVSFYRPVHGPLLSNCFIETFKAFIEERKCFDDITQLSHRPCCQDSSFPYSARVVEDCLGPALDMFYRTPTYVVSREAPGVRFSRTSNKIVALIVQYYSNIPYSNSYVAMKDALSSIDTWFQEVLSSAPPGLQSSWFISDNLELFALQDSLVSGTYISVLIALFLALVSVMIVTRDVILTLFAVTTIGCIITSTLATLFYCFNWQVNVMESVVILVAIGISVDLPLHLVIGFKKKNHDDDDNEEVDDHLLSSSHKTFATLGDVGFPLLLAAVTTAVGGLWMFKSQILAYLRIGMFLVVISAWNVLFTFLLLTCLLLVLESWTKKSSKRQSQTDFLPNHLVLNDYDCGHM